MAITKEEALLYLAAILFCAGIAVLFTRRNLIMMLIGLELMLNAANLNLLAFRGTSTDPLQAEMFVFFIILVAVCEAAIGIALVVRVYRFYQTSLPDQVNELNERH